MQIGSFIEMDFPKSRELYKGIRNIARLNTGRAAIYHSVRLWNCDTAYLPVYQCETVREFLLKKGIAVKYYCMDRCFNPLISFLPENACIVIVNYFGIMSKNRMEELAFRYGKVIIDNSQAFYNKPLTGVYNVYSARKFVGVPDGAYVIGDNAEAYLNEYSQGYSSDTSLFLLQRIEYGCEGKTYENRSVNEKRIDTEDIMKMSALTHSILDGCNYEDIRSKRKENFEIARELFDNINKLNVLQYYDETCVPMVYPLVVEDDFLLKHLLDGKHFQGHWWSYILNEAEKETFEYWLSRYMIPITIDQRYGRSELEYVRGLI